MSQPPPNDLVDAARQSLSQRDFHKCREYALAVPKSDPRFPWVAKILAVADTLIAGETQVTEAKEPDWYAILQLNRYCHRYSLIAEQFKKLYSLLTEENRFPHANEAAELTLRAYSVLKDSSKKLEFDDDLQDSELPKVNRTFWFVCTICSNKYVFDNKAYEGGVSKCKKCRIKPIKAQSKNNLKMDQPPPNDLFEAAKQSLSQRDFQNCREYALAVPKSDPRFPGVAKIIAVADTLTAGEVQVTKAKDPNWYAVLQLNRYCQSYSLIADQFKKLYSLLNPDENQFPLANEAAELVCRAYSVLKQSSTKRDFDVELSKENRIFWVVCSICSNGFVYNNKAIEGGVFKCPKCRINPLKAQSKNDLRIVEKSQAGGIKWSFCKQCSEPFVEVTNESMTDSTSSDDQEPGFICRNCITNPDDATDSFWDNFPSGSDEGLEWIKDVLKSTPTEAVNLTGHENLTGGNKSVADQQINVEEGGEDDDTTWITCPTCSKTYQYSGVRQKRFLICKNLECRGKGRAPGIIIPRRKEEDKKLSSENVKTLMGKRADTGDKDNAGKGKGNGNQGTNAIRKLWNPFPTRAKNSMRQENLSAENKFDAGHAINVEGVGGENAAAAADTVWVSCPHCSFNFKQVGVPQEGLPKCQNAICGKEFNVLDAMLLYQKLRRG